MTEWIITKYDGFFDAYWVHPLQHAATMMIAQRLGANCVEACNKEAAKGGSKPVRVALSRVTRAVAVVVQRAVGELP